MTISLKHAHTAVGPDAGNGEVASAEWNANHLLTQASGALLGRTTAGAGATEEVPPGANLAFSGGALVVTAPGSDNQVVYNDGGSLAASADVEIDGDGNLLLVGQPTAPVPPPAGKLKFLARTRAGTQWPEVMRSSGRDFPLMPHIGFNKIGMWLVNTTTTITTWALLHAATGTISHPTPATTSLKDSVTRWRVTSAATAGAIAEQRGTILRHWRGNAPGLGGFTYTARIALTTLVSNSVGFFGLTNSTTAFGATQSFPGLLNHILVGFRNGTDTNWQVSRNDGSGSSTPVDTGIPFNTTDLLTLTIHCAPNAASIWVRLVNDTTGAVFETELTTDLPSNTTMLAPRSYLSNVATASAVAYDCCGVYIESDY